MQHTGISNPSAIDRSDRISQKVDKTKRHYGPEELARMIIEETPDALEPFGTAENMAAYIREAMIAEYEPTA